MKTKINANSQQNEQILKEYERVINDQKIRISDLKRELQSANLELNQYKEKNNNISNALVVAVETAKQIENSSKNVYDLEIKRIKNLYSKWEYFLKDLMKKYPSTSVEYNSQKLLDEFSGKIDEIIKQNSLSLGSENNPQPVGIRNLISKMGGVVSKQVEMPSKTIYIQRQDVEHSANQDEKLEKITEQETMSPKEEMFTAQLEKTNSKNDAIKSFKKSNLQETSDLKKPLSELKLKPIANVKTGNNKSGIEKFFEDNNEAENAYSKALIRKRQSSGFDLKEALNPTEDLAQIMKEFDFFDDDKSKD